MARFDPQPDLFSTAGGREDTVAVNDRCLLRTQESHRVIVVHGIVIAQYAVGDRMAEAHAMVNLVEQGWADQNDVARTFGRSARTVRRYQERFEEGGLAALGRGRGYPQGHRRVPLARSRQVLRLKGEGLSNRAIAHHVGISEKAIRKLLRRLGWAPSLPRQEPLPVQSADPKLSAFPKRHTAPDLLPSANHSDAVVPFSLDTDPANRRFDRVLAHVGLLDDATPLFQSAARLPRAGVLLAIPPLLASGALSVAREIYGSIGPAFYGLRTTLMALLLMALLRIKRPEQLKEHSPPDLGRLLGLDRAPEVKTLRRKLARLGALRRAAAFGSALAVRRVAARGAALGFLYVDGHVRVYHGKHRLPKAHVARMRLAAPATSDYWVNDTQGEPLFVVTAEANAGLVKMLPPVLAEVRRLVGERRVTVVFDRGGWSPRLFERLISGGFDLLTYRKGRFRRVAKKAFREHAAVINGRQVTYTLADQGIALLGGRLRLRQVTRRSENGHQTPIVTSRRDLRAAKVAFRMFERWRQENFFKYLREEYALDALVDYAVEPDDPQREVPNPARTALDRQLREARAELVRLQADYGRAACANPERRRPTIRGFKIAHGQIGGALRKAMQRVATLQARRAATPPRVPVHEVVVGEVVKLAPERKHLTNLIKMVAYQAESDLVRLVVPHYKRAEDEGRTLIQSALASAADIEVTDTELRIVLSPLSSAHRTRAIAALCDTLNLNPVCFPGTRLRLRYAVAGPR